MLVEQINAVRSEPAQRSLHDLADSLRPAVQAIAHIAVLEAKLGGDHDLIAHRGQRVANHLLVQRAIGLGGVEEGDAALECGFDHLDASGAFKPWTIAVAQAHAAEPQGRDFKAGTAEHAFVHLETS